MTGCLTSTGSWPNFLPGEEAQPWEVRTCWYVGIVFGLTSILAAADQTIRLHRISGHRNAPRRIRILIRGNTRRKGGQIRPTRARMYIWQLPVFFLTCAVVAMMVGIWVLVWEATIENGVFVWKEDAKVSGLILFHSLLRKGANCFFKSAVVFTVITGLVGIVFFWAQSLLHASVHDEDDEYE